MQRRFVLMEIESDDPVPPGEAGRLPIERWVWDDFAKCDGITLHRVLIMSPQHCGDCDDIRDQMEDFLCKHCRRNAVEGHTRYEDYLKAEGRG